MRRSGEVMAKDEYADIDRLPVDLLSHIFALISSFLDLAHASIVCRKWKQGVEQSLARRKSLSFAGWNMDDDSIARLVGIAYNLKELDMYSPDTIFGFLHSLVQSCSSRSSWSCRLTDNGLYKISMAMCVRNLTSISLWGMVAITDKGVTSLVSSATSLQHLNIGGTFITDESLYAIADNCPNLKAIVLWSCRHVIGNGLITLVNKCRKLESINVWGMRVPVDCFISLLAISPALEIKPGGLQASIGRVSLWPVL